MAFPPTSGIVVLGATNNVDNLDPALIRPGRFDRTCHLGLPNVDEREALFALYAEPPAHRRAIGFPAARAALDRPVARVDRQRHERRRADGRQGGCRRGDAARISSVCSSSSSWAGRPRPGQSAMNAAERQRIAVHEAGHALVAKLLNVGVVEKVSILKRGARSARRW